MARKRGSTKWNIGTYSRFIKQARLREKLTVPQARALYRELRSQYDKPIFPSYFRRPGFRSIAKEESIRIKQSDREARAAALQEFGKPSIGPSGSPQIPTHFQTLQQWEDWHPSFEDWDDSFFDLDDYEGTASYKSDEG